MPKKITTKIIINVDEAHGKHKVFRQGVVRDETGTFPDAPFNEPARRVDIEAILGGEVGLNAERVTALTSENEALQATIQSQAAEMEEAQATIEQLQAKLSQQSESGTISATQLRLKLLEIGFDNARIEDVFAQLEAVDPAEAERVRIIWEYNTWYKRTDPLVDMMAGFAELTAEQVDALFGLAPPTD